MLRLNQIILRQEVGEAFYIQGVLDFQSLLTLQPENLKSDIGILAQLV